MADEQGPPSVEPRKGYFSARYGIQLEKITPGVVKDIVGIFANTACTNPIFWTDPKYTDDLIGLGFSPEREAKKIADEQGLPNGNPTVISSLADFNEEAVLFTQRDPDADDHVIVITYNAGDYRYRFGRQEIERREALFDDAVNAYLKEKNLAIEPETA